jgi:hypothetical protein
MTAQIRQIPPAAVSNSEKSVCQTSAPSAGRRRPGGGLPPRTCGGAEPTRQQQPAAAQGAFHGRAGHRVAVGAQQRGDLAMPPRRLRLGVLRRHRLDLVHRRRRPRTFHRLAVAKPSQAAVIGATRDPREAGEPRNRQIRCRSQGFEVAEGTWSVYSAPFCHIRSCTVASASAIFSWPFSNRSRRSSPDPPFLLGPARHPVRQRLSPRIKEPVPPTQHRRHTHPCRRAASDADISPPSTASTTRTFSSIGNRFAGLRTVRPPSYRLPADIAGVCQES